MANIVQTASFPNSATTSNDGLVHFKLSTAQKFEEIRFTGNSIPVPELKNIVTEMKKLNSRGQDFSLSVYDTLTDGEYRDSDSVSSGSRVVVRRNLLKSAPSTTAVPSLPVQPQPIIPTTNSSATDEVASINQVMQAAKQMTSNVLQTAAPRKAKPSPYTFSLSSQPSTSVQGLPKNRTEFNMKQDMQKEARAWSNNTPQTESTSSNTLLFNCPFSGMLLIDAVELPCCFKVVSEVYSKSCVVDGVFTCPSCSTTTSPQGEFKPAYEVREKVLARMKPKISISSSTISNVVESKTSGDPATIPSAAAMAPPRLPPVVGASGVVSAVVGASGVVSAVGGVGGVVNPYGGGYMMYMPMMQYPGQFPPQAMFQQQQYHQQPRDVGRRFDDVSGGRSEGGGGRHSGSRNDDNKAVTSDRKSKNKHDDDDGRSSHKKKKNADDDDNDKRKKKKDRSRSRRRKSKDKRKSDDDDDANKKIKSHKHHHHHHQDDKNDNNKKDDNGVGNDDKAISNVLTHDGDQPNSSSSSCSSNGADNVDIIITGAASNLKSDQPPPVDDDDDDDMAIDVLLEEKSPDEAIVEPNDSDDKEKKENCEDDEVGGKHKHGGDCNDEKRKRRRHHHHHRDSGNDAAVVVGVASESVQQLHNRHEDVVEEKTDVERSRPSKSPTGPRSRAAAGGGEKEKKSEKEKESRSRKESKEKRSKSRRKHSKHKKH